MKTKLGGNRIADKSIGQNHLKEDLKIPEMNLQLNYPTHGHENKSVLDIIKNSNPSLAKSLDLVDVVLTILQVADCRPNGETLKTVIESKADGEDFATLKALIDEAMAGHTTLKEALDAFTVYLDDKLSQHIGLVSHAELDGMYSEVEVARGIFPTLGERIDYIALNGGAGSGGGTTTISNPNILAMTPWNAIVTVSAGQRDIPVPNSYTVGNQSIEVWEDSLLLMPGADNDYEEVDENTIHMNYDLPEGTQLRICGTNAGRLYDWCIRYKSAEGQTDLNTIYNYKMGYEELIVFEDGLRLAIDYDYTEKDSRTITMREPLPANCNITICKRRY